MIITNEDNNENATEEIGELITWESILKSFVCQNGHYKLTCQCENTISSAFALLQSNNLLLI